MTLDLGDPVAGGTLVGAVENEAHDEGTPLVLLLHGGPGASVESLAGLEREFLPRAREFEELYGLVWPAYAASPSAAPPMPAVRLDLEVYEQLLAAALGELPRLEAALAVAVPVLLVRGTGSPVPETIARSAAQRLPDAVVEEVADAGHFLWLERPGSAGQALDRLLQRLPGR